jgi:putative nucleotidyltransferase with HDIG domain
LKKKQTSIHHKQEIIHALTDIIEMIDPYTRDHGKNVAHYATLLAKSLGLPAEHVETIYYGALFHDIGKIGVPIAIIRKKGPLTKHEHNLIKKHPEKSIKILSHFSDFKDIIPMVRHHHEMFMGSGYPDGLVGKKIPLESRILSIADVYDAITSNRSYHRAHGSKYAINYIIKNTPQQFDPDLVKVFVTLEKKL